MNNDAEKTERISVILETQNLADSFEVVGLALSVQDEEDRDLQLFNVVKWLIDGKIWQKSYGVAQLISDGYEKVEALRLVGDYLASIGHLEKAISIFDEAGNESSSSNILLWQQAELLHKIAVSLDKIRAYFKANDFWEKAVLIARQGEESRNEQDSLDASSVLAEIVEYLIGENQIEKALNVAQKIKNIGKKEKVLQIISANSQQARRVA